YPAAVIAGGKPRFPSVSDCRTRPGSGAVLLVFGHTPSYEAALRLRTRAIAAGFPSTRFPKDGCGRVRVFVGDVPSASVAETLAKRADAAGVPAVVEDDPTR